MSQSTDESRIRETIRRLKQADTHCAPDFNDVLTRPVRNAIRRPVRRLQFAAVCCAAATVLAAILFVRSQHRGPALAPDPRTATGSGAQQPVDLARDQWPQQRDLDIDFDRLRRVVEEHCGAAETATGTQVLVWSSRTESLLALNCDVSLTQE